MCIQERETETGGARVKGSGEMREKLNDTLHLNIHLSSSSLDDAKSIKTVIRLFQPIMLLEVRVSKSVIGNKHKLCQW